MSKSAFPVPGDCVDVAGIDSFAIDVADVVVRRTVVVVVADAICDGIVVLDAHASRMSNKQRRYVIRLGRMNTSLKIAQTSGEVHSNSYTPLDGRQQPVLMTFKDSLHVPSSKVKNSSCFL